MKYLLHMTVACLLLIPFYNSYADQLHPMDGTTYTVEGPNSNNNRVGFSLPGTMHMPIEPGVNRENWNKQALCPSKCVITTKYKSANKATYIKSMLIKEFFSYGQPQTKPKAVVYIVDSKHPATISLAPSGTFAYTQGQPFMFHIVNLGCNDKDQCAGDPKQQDIQVQCTETYPNDPYCYKENTTKPKGK